MQTTSSAKCQLVYKSMGPYFEHAPQFKLVLYFYPSYTFSMTGRHDLLTFIKLGQPQRLVIKYTANTATGTMTSVGSKGTSPTPPCLIVSLVPAPVLQFCLMNKVLFAHSCVMFSAFQLYLSICFLKYTFVWVFNIFFFNVCVNIFKIYVRCTYQSQATLLRLKCMDLVWRKGSRPSPLHILSWIARRLDQVFNILTFSLVCTSFFFLANAIEFVH